MLARLQRHLLVHFWAGAALWPQKRRYCERTLGVIVSLGGVRLPLQESVGLTQIHSLSVGGTFSLRMSSELLGTKNKWLTCEAQARMFVCYCVFFHCVVQGWYVGTFQTLFECNYHSTLMPSWSLFCFFEISQEKVALLNAANEHRRLCCNLTSCWDLIVASEIFKSHSFLEQNTCKHPPYFPPAPTYTSTPPPRWNDTTRTFLAFQKLTDYSVLEAKPPSCPLEFQSTLHIPATLPPTSCIFSCLLLCRRTSQRAHFIPGQKKKKRKRKYRGEKNDMKEKKFWSILDGNTLSRSNIPVAFLPQFAENRTLLLPQN